ncbi:hypothetical protein ACF0H5_023610 [Mactra antiquata]
MLYAHFKSILLIKNKVSILDGVLTVKLCMSDPLIKLNNNMYKYTDLYVVQSGKTVKSMTHARMKNLNIYDWLLFLVIEILSILYIYCTQSLGAIKNICQSL